MKKEIKRIEKEIKRIERKIAKLEKGLPFFTSPAWGLQLRRNKTWEKG